MEDDLKKKQSTKINLIGCDTIVNCLIQMSIFMYGQQHHQNKLPSVPRKPKQRDSNNSPLREVNIEATKCNNSSNENLMLNGMKRSHYAKISTM